MKNKNNQMLPNEFEYNMSEQLAKEILATRKNAEKNMHPQVFLCKVVNETFGLRGHCVSVTTY